MSGAYHFAIGRTRALILAGCFAAAALLLFFAGALTGFLYSNSHEASRRVVVPQPVVKAPKAPEIKAPELAPAPLTGTGHAPSSGAASSASSSTSQMDATSTVPPVENAPAAAAATASAGSAPAPATAANAPSAAVSASATTAKSATSAPGATDAKAQTNPKPSTPAVESSYAVPLAVQVGFFTLKSNAESLIQSLQDLGYQPVMGLYIDGKGRQCYVVKLGPYLKWNIASQVAARVSIAENVTPVIGPMQ